MSKVTIAAMLPIIINGNHEATAELKAVSLPELFTLVKADPVVGWKENSEQNYANFKTTLAGAGVENDANGNSEPSWEAFRDDFNSPTPKVRNAALNTMSILLTGQSLNLETPAQAEDMAETEPTLATEPIIISPEIVAAVTEAVNEPVIESTEQPVDTQVLAEVIEAAAIVGPTQAVEVVSEQVEQGVMSAQQASNLLSTLFPSKAFAAIIKNNNVIMQSVMDTNSAVVDAFEQYETAKQQVLHAMTQARQLESVNA